MIGVVSQSTQRANYDRDGSPQAPGSPVARTLAADEYEIYLQDSWQPRSNLTITGGVRYSLVLAALRDQRPAGAAHRQHGRLVRRARSEHGGGHPVEPQSDHHLRPVRAEEQPARLLRVGQEQHRAAPGGGVEPDRHGRLPARRSPATAQ